MNVIELNHLSKTYKRFEKKPGLKGSLKSLFHREYIEKTAVSDFNLSIRKGEFVGIIGQNGAGKTTLVKMLTGIIPPTTGTISVLGYYPNNLENAFKKRYAVVMGQKSQLFFELTPADTFLLFKEIYDISEKDFQQNLEEFINLFQIEDLLHVQVRTLSLGERMKMELVVALLHNPEILFLDEPTIGLDAIAQKQIRMFLKEVNQKKGTTILLTSHYMDDIKSLCKRSLVVEKGQKVYDGPTEILFNQFQHHKQITITFESEQIPLLPDDCQILQKTAGKLVFQVPKDLAGATMETLFAANHINDILIEEEDISTIVERIYDQRGGLQL